MTDLHYQIAILLMGTPLPPGHPVNLLKHSSYIDIVIKHLDQGSFSEEQICLDILIQSKRLEALVSPVPWIRDRARRLA